MNPTKNREWIQMPRKDWKFLLHTWNPSYFSCYKPGDKSWMRKGQDCDNYKWKISVVMGDTDLLLYSRPGIADWFPFICGFMSSCFLLSYFLLVLFNWYCVSHWRGENRVTSYIKVYIDKTAAGMGWLILYMGRKFSTSIH